MDYTHNPDGPETIYHDLDPAPTPFQFPTSSARCDAAPPRRTGSTPPEQRYDPLGIFKQAEDAARRAALLSATQYSTDVPRPRTVAPGVLSDGSITIGHPELRYFIKAAEDDPRAAPPTCPTVFALAALAVFYHPNRPAHWIFWAKDRRENTANIVQKVLDAQPILIKSPISWIGIPESLWVLQNLQYGWREQLAKTPWYSYFAEPVSPGKTRMNLRKRKAPREQPPIEPRENEEGVLPVSTPRKRPRTRRIGPSARAVSSTKQLQEESVSQGVKGECVTPLSSIPPSPGPELPTSASQPTLPTPSIEIALVQSSPSSTQRSSLRQKAQRAKATLSVPSSTPTCGTRDPSPSSCCTAVSRGRGRSSSSASASLSEATTAVEVEAGGDGKLGKEVDGDVEAGAPRTRASPRTRATKEKKGREAAPKRAAPASAAKAVTNGRARQRRSRARR